MLRLPSPQAGVLEDIQCWENRHLWPQQQPPRGTLVWLVLVILSHYSPRLFPSLTTCTQIPLSGSASGEGSPQ